jgi:hypothetical protein
LTGPEVAKLFMGEGGGGVVSPSESCSSASWVSGSPLLALMSRR